MSDRDLLQQALEALDNLAHYADACELFLKETHPGKSTALGERVTKSIPAIASLRTAIAEAEKQEQSGLIVGDAYDKIDRFLRNNLDDTDYAEYSDALDRLYTTPPAAQRQPLTAGEISLLWKRHTNEDGQHFLPYEDDGLDFARAIEAAHGITGEQP